MPMSLYQLLGVDETATTDEIKKQYKQLALLYHPDKSNDCGSKFKEISHAYSILANVENRRDYDASLRRRNRELSRTDFSRDMYHDMVDIHHQMQSMHHRMEEMRRSMFSSFSSDPFFQMHDSLFNSRLDPFFDSNIDTFYVESPRRSSNSVYSKTIIENGIKTTTTITKDHLGNVHKTVKSEPL